MASVRDVLSHAGKPVTFEDGRHGLGMRRGDSALFEPQLAPQPGERVRFEDTGERFVLVEVVAEQLNGRLDHYRATLRAAPG